MRQPTMTIEQVRNLPALISKKEVAELTGLHPRTVQAMARNGKLPSVIVGNRYVFVTARILELYGLSQ